MHIHVTEVKDSGDFAYFVRNLVNDEEFEGRLDLDAYLRALWGLILKYKDFAPSWTLFAYIIEEAFDTAPQPFDPAWMDYLHPPDLKESDPSFATLQQMILYQIADLRRMRDAGTLDLPGEILFGGVASPTGHQWYNFTSYSFLVCAVASADDSVHRNECGWNDLALLLWLGQIYE